MPTCLAYMYVCMDMCECVYVYFFCNTYIALLNCKIQYSQYFFIIIVIIKCKFVIKAHKIISNKKNELFYKTCICLK